MASFTKSSEEIFSRYWQAQSDATHKQVRVFCIKQLQAKQLSRSLRASLKYLSTGSKARMLMILEAKYYRCARNFMGLDLSGCHSRCAADLCKHVAQFCRGTRVLDLLRVRREVNESCI